jgi:hypothetical protein
MTKKASTEYSAGARYERAALRAYLRRVLRNYPESAVSERILAWVVSRQKRYDSKAGGLGK